MKKLALCLILTVLTCAAHADDPVQSMHDAFARGFEATKAKNREEAEQWFEKAGQFAVQAKEWKGCLDAGSALLKLGQPAKSSGFFDQAFSIAKAEQDWRIAVAVGYGYASLPADQNRRQNASDAFLLAGDSAGQKSDWIGLTEAANGLIQVENRDQARAVLDDAKKIVDQTKSIKGAQVVAQLYDRLGLAQESQEMKSERQNFSDLHENARKNLPPPPGWKPVGESVAGPYIPSAEQQKAARASADQTIEQTNQWILQQEQIEAKHAQSAKQYSSYYYYPYGYASYTHYQPWDWNHLVSWADSCSTTYIYTDGHYQCGSDYVGFGFSYGYSGSDSFFGVSLHVD